MCNQEDKKVFSIKHTKHLKQIGINKEDQGDGIKAEMEQLEQNIQELQQKKAKMMEDLKVAIQQEKDQWHQTKEMERQEVRMVAYKIGYDEGIEKAHAEWEDTMKEADEMVHEANKNYMESIKQREEAIVQLAAAAANETFGNVDAAEIEQFNNILLKKLKAQRRSD